MISNITNSTTDDSDHSNKLSLNEKLFNLRLKINQSRKANKDEVSQEYLRLNKKNNNKKKDDDDNNEDIINLDPNDNNNNHDNKNDKNSNKWKNKNNDDIYMYQTAEQAEYEIEKQLKKEQSRLTFGWQAYTVEAKYRSYEKSLKHLPVNKININENSSSSSSALQSSSSQPSSSSSSSLIEINPFLYGKQNLKITQSGLDRLTSHIEQKEIDRKKFHKRRIVVDAHNVDYINDRNAAFNKKLKKSFDKYTVEIRQNLERGTAV
jgi:hypothetical protein